MIEFFSFQKKSNSHKLESFFFGGVQESKILILDPGLDYKGLRYYILQNFEYLKLRNILIRRFL